MKNNHPQANVWCKRTTDEGFKYTQKGNHISKSRCNLRIEWYRPVMTSLDLRVDQHTRFNNEWTPQECSCLYFTMKSQYLTFIYVISINFGILVAFFFIFFIIIWKLFLFKMLVTFLLEKSKLLMKYFILIFSYIIKMLSNNII